MEVAEEELTPELREGGKAPEEGAGEVAEVVCHQAGAEFLKQADEILYNSGRKFDLFM